jgi:proteasome lid subunit RPN8/RPN11
MITQDIKNSIKKQSLKDFPLETCGFIVEKNNEIKMLKCKNIDENPAINFRISSSDYLKIKKEYNILYIYHSHPVKQDFFSQTDISTANNLNLPMILYSIISDLFKIYNPKKYIKYLNLNFKYKENDCLTLIKNYYFKELNQNININRIYDVFEKKLHFSDLSSITKENFINSQNFKEIQTQDLKENDIVLLINTNNYPCHYGLYIDNYQILHQTVLSKSRIDNYFEKQSQILFGLRMNNL